MKFNVGEVLRIRRDLISVDEDYGKKYYMEDGIEWNDVTVEMREFGGQEATVESTSHKGYVLSIDNGMWSWTDEMLEKIEK